MNTKPAEFKDEIERFRSADPEQPAEKKKLTTHSDGRDARISKTIRIRLKFSEMLRDESYRRSSEKGERVSEADIIDEIMNEWRLKHKVPTE